MANDRRLHNELEADQLWKACRRDSDLRWVLEGVLSTRIPELGRVLLLSPVELFGEAQARIDRKLSLLFNLTGFPYLSGGITELSRSLQKMMAARHMEPQQASDAKSAIAEWMATNSRQAQDLLAAATLETVRLNEPLRKLASSDEPVTNISVAQQIPDYAALDWRAVEKLGQLFEPFLARSRSKKPINRFTLNFTALLHHFQLEISQQDVILRSAQHFINLLQSRRVSEPAWRALLLKLVDRELLSPYTSMFIWCRRFPEDGFVASSSLALGALPPVCPSCAEEANAMACFAPARGLNRAMRLKDGLLGAAVGWHLTKRRIRFWHSLSQDGTEMDFIPILSDGHLLIECKVLSVLVPPKQLGRTLREASKQLREHRDLLERRGWKLNGSICVVNLTDRQILSLRRERSMPNVTEGVISYERFTDWLKSWKA